LINVNENIYLKNDILEYIYYFFIVIFAPERSIGTHQKPFIAYRSWEKMTMEEDDTSKQYWGEEGGGA